MTDFSNVYHDKDRADAYAQLEFPGTYYLAYRDLPAIIREHVRAPVATSDAPRRALDFGCGAGRSTRFLRGLGFDPLGIDISASMLERARAADPGGDYRLVKDGEIGDLEPGSFDLVLSAFTFDNIPTFERKLDLFRALRSVLRPHGRIVNLVSSPLIYLHEWASFSTKDFPENHAAGSGDRVRIIMLDVPDRRPVEDVICTDDDYRDVYRKAGLEVVKDYRPLAKEDEPFEWVSETSVPPWVIWVLR